MSWTFNIITGGEAPNAPGFALASTSDTGASSSDKITSNLAPDFIFTFDPPAEIGDVAKIYKDSVLYATSEVMDADDIADGLVRFSFSAFTDGTYDMQGSHVNPSGESDKSAVETVTFDTDSPDIVSLTPTDNATDVDQFGALIQAEFDENIAFSTAVVISVRLTSDDSVVQAFTEDDIGTGISITGDTLMIELTDPLEFSTEYYILVGSTSLIDAAGNFFAGISSTTAWSFTAEAAPPTGFRQAQLGGMQPYINVTGTTSPNNQAQAGQVYVRQM